MVYNGKPSKGCHNCRKRKIQCDQLPDGCSQCSRSQRQCPGYPELPNFTFRDQTQSIIRRSQTKASYVSLKSSATATPSKLRTESPCDDATAHSQLEGSPMILTSLRSWSPSGDEQASAFFMSKFFIDAGAASESHFEGSLERIAQINYEAEDHLLASMKATGFAGLFGTFRDPALLVDARKQYVKAVRHTSIALKSPDQVKRDGTLLAVLVLGLFERVVGGDNESFMNYEHHVRGAAAILKFRGHEQLNSNEGRRMFIQVISVLLSLCMLQELHIPHPILELRENPIIRAGVAQHESMQVLDMSITCVEFSASVKDGTFTDPKYILGRALELDMQLIMISDKVPPSWRYKTVYDTNADPRAVFAGCYHEYASIWTARMWNIIRLARLSLHTNIRDTLLKNGSPNLLDSISLGYSAQLVRSTDVLRMIQADLLATVPVYMGLNLSLPRYTIPHQATSGQQSIDEGASREQPMPARTPTDSASLDASLVARAQYIIFCLYKAGMVDVDETTKAGRLWSLQMLQYVGQVVGIRQALIYAAIIEQSVQ